MAKKEIYPNREELDLFINLIQTLPGIERKGATMPYASFNGNMFSFLDKDGFLALRLPEKEREIFIRENETTLCEAHGTILKEYVKVPSPLFRNFEKMKHYFEISFNYVNSLKPKNKK